MRQLELRREREEREAQILLFVRRYMVVDVFECAERGLSFAFAQSPAPLLRPNAAAHFLNSSPSINCYAIKPSSSKIPSPNGFHMRTCSVRPSNPCPPFRRRT